MRRDHVLADVRGGDPSFLDAVLAGVFTVPGDGAVDYGALLAAPKSIRAGWSSRRSKIHPWPTPGPRLASASLT